jgi:putative acetyltransferase
MTRSMQIRRFNPGEESTLFDIYYSAIHLIARLEYTEAQTNAWAPANLDRDLWVKRIRGINPFVAEVDGVPVGYADVQENGYIDHFFVSGWHPRQGIGKSLMAVLESEARRMGLAEMTSDVSRTAQPFFQNFGFEIVEQRVPVIRGIEVPNALMRKVLVAT